MTMHSNNTEVIKSVTFNVDATSVQHNNDIIIHKKSMVQYNIKQSQTTYE